MESLNNPKTALAVCSHFGPSLKPMRSGRGCGSSWHQRESLYRALSPKGNPTLKTLVAVLKTLGLRLSVTDKHQAEAQQAKQDNDFAAA